MLGEREPGTTRLAQAVEGYREVLKERTQEKAPLTWARIQCGLGDALQSLGEREPDKGHLEASVSAYESALTVFRATKLNQETQACERKQALVKALLVERNDRPTAITAK